MIWFAILSPDSSPSESKPNVKKSATIASLVVETTSYVSGVPFAPNIHNNPTSSVDLMLNVAFTIFS
jgi:hypothetical protein